MFEEDNVVEITDVGESQGKEIEIDWEKVDFSEGADYSSAFTVVNPDDA